MPDEYALLKKILTIEELSELLFCSKNYFQATFETLTAIIKTIATTLFLIFHLLIRKVYGNTRVCSFPVTGHVNRQLFI